MSLKASESNGMRASLSPRGKGGEMKETPRVGTTIICVTCGKRKAPVGRSVSPAEANSLCNHECSGYMKEPVPDYLFPGESDADFGYHYNPQRQEVNR